MYTGPISIQPVANGFVVTTPVMQKNQIPFDPDTINSFLGKIKMPGTDPILHKVENDLLEEEKQNQQQQKEADIDSFRDDSIHVFATLRLALDFIAEKYGC